MLTNAVDPDLAAQHLLFGRDILYLDWNHHCTNYCLINRMRHADSNRFNQIDSDRLFLFPRDVLDEI